MTDMSITTNEFYRDLRESIYEEKEMCCSDLHGNLNYFRHIRQYCDVIIQVQGEDFPCHRLVLASVSEFFHVMFGSCFKESCDPVVNLENIDATSFATILMSVYTGKECNLTIDNVHNILCASNFLRIHSVEVSCVHFISRNFSCIDHIDIIDLFRFVNNVNLTALFDKLSIYIIKNFKLFYNNEVFMEMSFNSLRCFLDNLIHNDELPFEFENLLLDFLIRWVHYAPEQRRVHFKDFFEVVNFEKISSDYITFLLKYFKNVVEVLNLEDTSNTIDASMMEERKLILNSRFTYRFYPQDTRNRCLLKEKIIKYFTTEEQSSGHSEDVMTLPFLYPNESSKNELGLHMYLKYTIDSIACEHDFHSGKPKPSTKHFMTHSRVFSLKNEDQEDCFCSCEINMWYGCQDRCTVIPQPADRMFCLETDDEYGNNMRQSFYSYSSIDMSLPSSVLTPPPVIFGTESNYNMCAVERDIFLYIPQPTKILLRKNYNYNFRTYEGDVLLHETISFDLHQYNCALDKWFLLPETQFKAYDSCLVADDNLVYLIGGESWTAYSKGVQAFDHRSSRWMTLPNCTSDPHRSIGSCLNGSIYMYSTSDLRYEIYDPKAGKWSDLPHPNLRPDHISKMVPYQNLMWVFIDCFDSTDEEQEAPNYYKIAQYNPISGEWHISTLLKNVISNETTMLNETVGLWLVGVSLDDVITFKAPVL